MATYGYIRVSTIDQTEGCSPEQQAQRIKGCAMLRGDTLGEVFYDAGVSAGFVPLADRPEGGKLVAGLQRGDTVIVAKLDRMFRSASDALVTAEKWQARGINLILTDMGTDPVTGNGTSKLFFSMLAAFAEFERDRQKERLAEGRKGKLAKGGHIGGLAPYGYRVEGHGRDAQLVPVEAEQAVIALVVELAAEGASLRTIGADLELRGFLNRGGKPWQAVEVKRILDRQARGAAA